MKQMMLFGALCTMFLGCTSNPLAPPPVRLDSHLSFREDLASGAVEIDGLEEIASGDVDAVGSSYDEFADDGVLADSGDAEEIFARYVSTCATASDRGAIVSVSLAAIYSPQGIKNKWDAWYQGLSALGYVDQTADLNPNNFAHLWRIQYCTVDYNGAAALGSGMIAVPGVGYAQAVDTTAYAHGTSVFYADTPSNLNVDETFDGVTPLLALVAGNATTGTKGDIVLAPDYTGFWTSNVPRHRYFDPVSEAASMTDMITAANDALPTFAVASSGKLFITGFSQGGHVALATTRALQAANVPVSGTITMEAMANPDPWNDTFLLPTGSSYLLLYSADLAATALDMGKLPGLSTTTVFKSQSYYDAFDMDHPYVDAVAAMPETKTGLFTSSFVTNQLNKSNSAFRVWLKGTSEVTGWCPTTKVQMRHSDDDDEVPYSLALADESSWKSSCANSALISLVTSTNGGGLPHLQSWNDELDNLGADLNALSP